MDGGSIFYPRKLNFLTCQKRIMNTFPFLLWISTGPFFGIILPDVELAAAAVFF